MSESLTHAGGLVYREGVDGVEFLIVRARRDPSVWVVPKGHIEAGESAGEAAVREVAEEAGVRGCVEGEIGVDSFEGPRGYVCALYFLMGYGGEIEAEEDRERRWVDGESAWEMVEFEGARGIVARAREMVGDL